MGELAAPRKRFAIEPAALFGTNCRMDYAQFSHIDTWIFDLDNTLYPPKVRLFDQIEEKMRLFVSNFLDVSLEEADVFRAQYWRSHGTTLAGMMDQHAMPPEAFLHFVHDIDFSPLPHSAELSSLISASERIHAAEDEESLARAVADPRSRLRVVEDPDRAPPAVDDLAFEQPRLSFADVGGLTQPHPFAYWQSTTLTDSFG